MVIYDEYGPVRMVRTEERKYVPRHPSGPDELYELGGDPDEGRNLENEPAHRRRAEELQALLGEWFAKYAVVGKDGSERGATGLGQLMPVGRPGVAEGGFARPD